MAKGVSIHIGLNYVDENHYGSSCSLPFCVNDAEKMQYIAEQNGYENHIIINEAATSHNFFYMLGQAASKLETDDILFVSFSGHGSYFKDLNGDEEDGSDEAILFYDKIIIDDQLNLQWAKFQPGVRILFISDSCYSGTITKKPARSLFQKWFSGSKLTDDTMANDIYKGNQRLYDAELKNIIPKLQTPVQCSVLLLSACQEYEVAGAGMRSELKLSSFTEVLTSCWANGTFEGNYNDFYSLLRAEMKNRNMSQRPNYYLTGKKHPYFEQQIPFSI